MLPLYREHPLFISFVHIGPCFGIAPAVPSDIQLSDNLRHGIQGIVSNNRNSPRLRKAPNSSF